MARLRLLFRLLGFLAMIASVRKQTGGISSCYAFASNAYKHRFHNTNMNSFRQPTKWMLRGGAWNVPSSSSPSSSSSSWNRPLYAATQSRSTSPSSISEYAKASRSIAGNGDSSLKSFGGLTYRDSSSSLGDKEEQFRVVFILGGPGAGKGTQCELLKQNYPCVHLSAGQLLREEAQKKDASEHAALIEECLVAGKIVPVEISLALLRNAMREANGQSLIFLIDGFPRNFDNLEGWTRVMATPVEEEIATESGNDKRNIGVAAVWGVLVYECPLPILEQRVMERSKDSGRSDDNLESLRRRFKTFQAETVPVIDTLRRIEDDTLLKVVDIRGDQSLEQVWEETQKTMNSFIANDVLSANVRLLQAAVSKDVETYRSLCADELFEVEDDTQDGSDGSSLMSAEKVMLIQEGSDEEEFRESNFRCAEMTFVTGQKVSLSYDRTSDSGITFRETRIWSHQGPKGWRMVHFSRSSTP
mmetsp:Transcript_29778/g.55877  ORF Transcript_29778/g.55877 Transcript_29778/m.55877 type:complete len:473 (+) Transcript_29778:177-1595(+)